MESETPPPPGMTTSLTSASNGVLASLIPVGEPSEGDRLELILEAQDDEVGVDARAAGSGTIELCPPVTPLQAGGEVLLETISITGDGSKVVSFGVTRSDLGHRLDASRVLAVAEGGRLQVEVDEGGVRQGRASVPAAGDEEAPSVLRWRVLEFEGDSVEARGEAVT